VTGQNKLWGVASSGVEDIKREKRYVLGAQNLPDISIFNFPAKSARIGAASSGDIATISY